ncbi:MAG TPA: hypothetical protein VEJ43_07005 [Pseudolabrys sp.]|nr:hypothetical protein [Pseudolabrys sp.]
MALLAVLLAQVRRHAVQELRVGPWAPPVVLPVPRVALRVPQPAPGPPLLCDCLALQQLPAWRLAPLPTQKFRFLFSFSKILHAVAAAVPRGSVLNWLNEVEFTDPAVDHADVIENEGLLSFHNRTLRLPKCASFQSYLLAPLAPPRRRSSNSTVG